MNGPLVPDGGIRSRIAAAWLAAWPAAWPAVAIVGIGLGYVVLNLPRLGAESYWTDEQMSVGFANEGLVRMLRLAAGDLHPPLYSSVVWLWIRLTGTSSEAVVRLVSLLAIAIGLVVLGIVTWRRIGLGAAAVFVTLGVTSSLVASFAREARPHALALGLVSIATAAWLPLLGARSIGLRSVVLLGVVGGLAALTQYYALMVYAIEMAVLVAWLMFDRRWRSAVLVTGVAALSLVPVGLWLAVSWHSFTTIAPPLDLVWAEQVAGFVTEPYTSAAFRLGIQAANGLLILSGAVALAVIGLAIGLVRMRRDGGGPGTVTSRGPLGRGAAALAVAVIAVAIAVAESLALAPSLHFRSVLSILPPLYVGVAAAYVAPFRRFGTPAGGLVAFVLALAALTTPEPYMPPGVKDQWREAGAMIVRDVRAGLPADRVAAVEAPWGTRIDWILTLNNAVGRRAPASDLPEELSGLRWIASASDLLAVPADGPLLLAAFPYWVPDRHASIVAQAEARFGPCQDRSVQGITLLRCDPAGH